MFKVSKITLELTLFIERCSHVIFLTLNRFWPVGCNLFLTQ